MAAVNQASAVLPELGRRGGDVRRPEEITGVGPALHGTMPTRTVVWCVGVTPGPLTQALGLETVNGRIV